MRNLVVYRPRTLLEDFFGKESSFFNFPNFGFPEFREIDKVEETKEKYLVSVEIPGFEKEEIDVGIKGGTLEVKAKQEKGGKVTRNFAGSYTFPGIDESGVSSSYERGILSVVLPKLEPTPIEEPEIKKIEVK